MLIELVLNGTFSKLTIATGKLHIAAFAHAEEGHFLHYLKLSLCHDSSLRLFASCCSSR